MKKILIATIFLVLVVGIIQTTGQTIRNDEISNLKAAIPIIPYSYWKFNEGSGIDTYDANNRYNNDGIIFGGAEWTTNTISKYALDFDGTYGGVAIPNSPSLNPKGSFTIEALIYPRNFANSQQIVSHWGDEGDHYNQRSYSFHTIPGGGLRFAISDEVHQWDANFHIFDTPLGVLRLNEWNHVAAVYNKELGERKIYVNGFEIASRADDPITVLDSIAQVGIGVGLTSSSSSEFYFEGIIDNVKITHDNLDPSQFII